MHLPMPDPAPVTSAVLPSSRMISTPFRHDAVGFRPAEPVLGAGAWLVFAADPAAIAGAVDRREHRRIIDLAFVGLAAGRHRGDLQVTDYRKKFFKAPDEIAAGDLIVIKIELDAHIRRADFVDESRSVFGMAEKITGPVARIDRLDQQRDVRFGGCRGGTR